MLYKHSLSSIEHPVERWRCIHCKSVMHVIYQNVWFIMYLPYLSGKVVCFTIIQFVLDVRFGYVGSINRFWWLEITLQWFKVSWFVFPFGLRQVRSEWKYIFPATQVGRRIAMSRGIYMGRGFKCKYIYIFIFVLISMFYKYTYI